MFTYVSIPYSDPSHEIRAQRMRGFWLACAHLTRRGDRVVSPMTLEPMIHADPTLPSDWNGWSDYSERLMGVCDRMVIAALPGWDHSTGVAGEIGLALARGLPVENLPMHCFYRLTDIENDRVGECFFGTMAHFENAYGGIGGDEGLLREWARKEGMSVEIVYSPETPR
jgi:hypothetical protein